MSIDNNNNEFEHAIHRFKQHSQLSSVGEDFENKVFAKIKKTLLNHSGYSYTNYMQLYPLTA